MLKGKPDPFPLNNLGEKQKQTYESDREWDAAFNLWMSMGMGKASLIPGDHPNPNHEWNSNREGMIARLQA